MIRCNFMTVGKSGAALLGAAGTLICGAAQAQTGVQTATLPPQAAAQLTQISRAGIPAGTASYAELLAMNAGGQDNTVKVAGRTYPFAIRLGAVVSPRVKFIGGADLTLPQYGLGANWAARVDAEAIVSANLGGNSTVIPLTFNEVYFSPNASASHSPYAGFGIGPYFGDTTRFGGKIFVGARVSPRLSGELSLHFPGYGDPLLAAQLRGSF